jgi:hypothetical protein
MNENTCIYVEAIVISNTISAGAINYNENDCMTCGNTQCAMLKYEPFIYFSAARYTSEWLRYIDCSCISHHIYAAVLSYSCDIQWVHVRLLERHFSPHKWWFVHKVVNSTCCKLNMFFSLNTMHRCLLMCHLMFFASVNHSPLLTNSV